MISILDYGMANLRSVQKAFERLGHAARIISSPAEVKGAERLVVPGVGAFRDAIALLDQTGLSEAIREHAKRGRPLMGICLGLQLLMDVGYEDGTHKGLGIIPGECVRFTVDAAPQHLKVPHMGWNALQFAKPSPLFKGLAPGAYVYFVHSYHVVPRDPEVIAATADYGGPFVAAIAKDNVVATQFHPEKSQDAGAMIFRNFAEFSGDIAVNAGTWRRGGGMNTQTRPLLIPAIDLRNGQVVRLRRGDYNEQTIYEVDPVDIAKRFEDAGCTMLHVVDLDGAKEGKPANLGIVERIVRATKLQVEVGGGIRTEESMEYVLAIGARRIILGTRALADMVWFAMMARDVRFTGRLVLGLDAQEGLVRTHGWTRSAGESFKAVDIARDVDHLPLAAIIYTDIARDGMLLGPNVQATSRLLKARKNVPVIHSGGVTTLADLQALKFLDIEGIIVGRAIYEGTLKVEDAVKALRDD